MSSEDYDDPKLAAAWLAEQQANVTRYLDEQEVRHRGIAPNPAWFVAPYISLWTVYSMSTPSAVGWWVISGDLPTDYLSGHDATGARTALKAFASRWHEVSRYMMRGKEHPTVKIGRAENRKELGDLLERRAQTLQEWVDDDEMW